MAAEQLLDAADDQLRLERLRQDAVAREGVGARWIDRLGRAGQEHDRDVRQPRRVLHVRGDFVAVFSRHADVGQHDVGRLGIETRDRLVAIAHRHDLDVFVGERKLDHALNRDAVVREQESMRHLGCIGWIAPSL